MQVAKDHGRIPGREKLSIFVRFGVVCAELAEVSLFGGFLGFARHAKHHNVPMITTVNTGRCSHSLLADLVLASLFLHLGSKDLLVSTAEFGLNFLERSHRSLHPGVSNAISHGEALA